VSAWEQFALAFPETDNGAQYYRVVGNVLTMGSRTKALRQYFRFVGHGAFRVQATSSAPATIRPVAFTNVGGAGVVVIHASAGGVIAVRGMRPGRYGFSSSASTIDLGEVVAASDGELRFTLPGAGVYTLYGKS
jgi:hypothetical protein